MKRRAFAALLPKVIIVGILAVVVYSTTGAAAERSSPTLITPWLTVEQRTRLKNVDISLKDQNGNVQTLGALVDKPTLITFFYTRCQNASRCSTTVLQLAALQRQLRDLRIDDKVRLLAITYEPEFDTPDKLIHFTTQRGFALGAHALAIQLDSARQQRLLEELMTPVNFNAGWVNTHGMDANLIDSKGRFVRKYSTLLWNNDQVAEDLKRLLAER